MIRRLPQLLLPTVAAWLGLSVLLVAQPPAAGEIDAALEKAIRAATETASPSIVQIETAGGTDIIVSGAGGTRIRKGMGPTSGVIVAADGYIISSSFNFANKPQSIFVTVPGLKERYVAKVVSTDTTRMLTLLKIEAKDLKVPQATPKSEMRVGQTALAMGRTLDDADRPPSVSVGIISALNRIWGKAVQTDAKVSPANYGGPLVDIQGRILGVLVPASPFDQEATAGTQWYDSGIGFAIPLEDINAVLPKLKAGQTLQRGLLGVTPQSADLYSVPPKVGSVQPGSAAAKADIQVGDVIVEIDGKAVANQAQVMHYLGAKYEGDTAAVKVKRGNTVIDLGKVVLGGQQPALAQSFLGIIPVRDDPEPGVEVRYVYPKSAADTAGIKEGDRILAVGPKAGGPVQPFSGRDQLMARLRTAPAGTEIKVQVKRKDGGKTDTLDVKLGEIINDVPEKLPELASAGKAKEPQKPVGPIRPPMPPMPDDKKEEKKEEKKAETGLIERKTEGGESPYWIYVPKDYDPNYRYAVVVWLHPVGKNKKQDIEDFTDTWEDYCKENHIILVGPKAESDAGWLASEAEVVSRACQDVFANYTVDRQRVVMHGMGQGGQFAFYLGFQARDLVRGVATTGAVLANAAKEKDATKPLAFYIIAGGKDPLAKPIAETKDKLLEQKYPVIHREIPNMGHQYLDLKTLEELVRWIDSLDRI